MPTRNAAVDAPSHFWEIVIKGGALLAFALLVACLAIPLRPKFAEYRELDEKGKVLEAEKAALQRDIERREAELQMLERDPNFVGVKARDTLNLCKPGEVVFRFLDNGVAE
ncbi:MAG TPA: septum formation initiator family protein [Verrucomicrobiales bacterium]|nr:septum formation initiator family protein [Verrucomicrobiales bacterium]